MTHRTPYQFCIFFHAEYNAHVESSVAVYDILFVELARRERLYLATFDSKMLTTLTSIAKRPGVLVRAGPNTA